MKIMFVSSTGGHLSELLQLSQRLDPVPDQSVWVTHSRANSARILATYPGAEVHFVRSVESRQAGAALAVLPTATRLIRASKPDAVITTGAAVAVPFAVAARFARIPFHYVESAARFHGPSLTGRMVRPLHPHTLWCQVTPPWPGWRSAGSIFDQYRPGTGAGGIVTQPLRSVVVALGTQDNFGFRSAVEAVARAVDSLDPRPEVLWQVGRTDLSGLNVTNARDYVPEPELVEAMWAADVVVTHAGVGLAALALASGHAPVLVPRRVSRNEHTDDHQSELADFLTGRGLGVGVEAPDLDGGTLARARRIRIERLLNFTLSRLDLRPARR
jgi:UDP-N-acetylglucosamine--N-acetylmuramyl-(pentapeptide) pyrophosphoryl-undecaprenol N-acetylglucosamine transferase